MDKILEVFEAAWVRRFPIELWNINSVPQKDLVGRTNNAIERYNRHE
jgi:hypothetical protein